MPRFIALFVVAALLAGNLHAQDIERANTLREQLLGELGLGGVVENAEDPAETPPADPNQDAVLLPELKGLVLVPHIDQVSADPISMSEPKIEDRGVEPPAGVTAALEPFLGEPVTLATLGSLTNVITSAYRDGDRPVVDAFLPEQNVTGGVIQVVVVEGRVGEIRVEGAKHTDLEYVKNQIRAAFGEPIRQSPLQHDLDWLNQQPLRNASLLFESGEEYGQTDLIVQIDEARPFRAHAGFGNTGLDLTGENEWNFGLTKGFLFGTEQLLSYQFTGDSDFDGLQAHSAFWWAPLPWRHRVEAIGAFVQSDASIAAEDQFIDIGGESVLLAFDYVIPVERRPFGMDRLDYRFGFDFKSTNNNLEFGGAQIFDETAEILQFRAGFEGQLKDKFGPIGLAANLVWSPGDLTSSNDDASHAAQRQGASSDYFYADVSVERLFDLPNGWRLVAAGEGQWTNTRLISTEQLLAGGYRSVRGFDENLARGDGGILGKIELLAPTLEPFGRGQLQPILFCDIGWLTNVDAGSAEPDVTLSSAGFELKYQLGQRARLRAGYGWHLSTSGLDDLEEDGKFHFGATVHY